MRVGELAQRVVDLGWVEFVWEKPGYWRSAVDRRVGYDGARCWIGGGASRFWVVHEVGHWLVATDAERRMVNWGLLGHLDRKETRKREDDACAAALQLAGRLGADRRLLLRFARWQHTPLGDALRQRGISSTVVAAIGTYGMRRVLDD